MNSTVTVRPIDLPIAGFEELLLEARGERLAFLDRMSAEWQNGKARYDGAGEVLLGAFAGDELAGVCGLVKDPFLDNPKVGRLRHLYVGQSHRNKGVGSMLVRAILSRADGHFAIVRLRTEEEVRGAFYASFGFRPISDPHATHQIRFG